MVNRGASGGCITCKTRRVKCDETKPVCKECIRLGRKCAGYGNGRRAIRVRFKDETARYQSWPPDHSEATKTEDFKKPKKMSTSKCAAHRPLRLCNHPAIAESLQPNQQDTAVAFFLTYVTDIGRNLESTRGFLEFVRPVLATESHDSALSAAVNATSVKLWALLRPSNVAASLIIRLHNRALVRLQQAIYSPVEQGKEATVLAALMLQQHDTLTAVFDHQKACITHREGALALLTQKGRNMKNFKYHGHLLGNLFHSKISSCIRHRVPLTKSEFDWVQTRVLPALPSNPSSLLDAIGMSISRLQSTFAQSRSLQRDVALGALQELPVIVYKADAQLRAWPDMVPEFWRPRMIQSGSSILSSVVTYDGFCDIYPSIQIANIWNAWRIYRLIVENIKMELTCEPLITNDGQQSSLPTDNAGSQQLQETQSLIGDICRSIPFYLGNCSQPVSFYDINNPQLVFPSYHDLPAADEGLATYMNSNYYASRTDHYRHVVLHGPLHALSLLSSLIGLLFEGRDSIPARDALYRQKQWIEEQFHRSLYVMRFIPCISKPMGDSPHLRSLDRVPTAVCQPVRQALWTVNIL